MILKTILRVSLAVGVATLASGLSSEALAKEVEVELKVGDSLSYSKKKIEVAKGSKVTLTLTHTGKMSKQAMGHNFVLLKKGTKMKAFAMRAMAAAKNDYIPKDMEGKIVAHTKLLGGGESDTITFDAPEPGEYVFLCSFPGHYTAMNGKFIVK